MRKNVRNVFIFSDHLSTIDEIIVFELEGRKNIFF